MGSFAQILVSYGRSMTWSQRQPEGAFTAKGEIKALIQPVRAEEVVSEAGYTSQDYRNLYTDKPVAHLDRFVFDGDTWEALPVQHFESGALGEEYYSCMVRRRRT